MQADSTNHEPCDRKSKVVWDHLPAREKGQGGDVKIHIQHEKIDQDGHLPHLAWTERSQFGKLRVVLDHLRLINLKPVPQKWREIWPYYHQISKFSSFQGLLYGSINIK
jgi:hypothetical protein